MGTIILFPFVVWDWLYSTTQLPKLLFLSTSIFILSLLSFLTPWKISRRGVILSVILFFVLSGLFFWNFFHSPDNWISLMGSLERYMGFLTYLLIFLFVFLAFSIHKPPIMRQLFWKIIISIWVWLSMIAIGQYLWIFENTLIWSMIFEGRAMATIWQYNTFWALLILPVWFILIEWKWFQNKILPILILLILFVWIWTTGSRIALIGWIWLILLFLITEKWRKYALIGGIILSIWALVSLSGYISESGRASLESRKLLFSDAISQLEEFSLPEHIMGRGFETIQPTLLREYSPKYLAYEQINYIPDRVHNIFLDTYIQFGILGSMVFLLVFLVYPFILFWRWESHSHRNYWLILFIHFLILSVGFYDIANLFFGAILIGYIYFDSQNNDKFIIPNRGIQYTIALILLGLSVWSIYYLMQDAHEQATYIGYQDEQDELLGIIQDDEIIHMIPLWNRNDLIAKTLTKYLNNTSETSNAIDPLFQRLCTRNSYHINQVCIRFAYLKRDYILLDTQIQILTPLAPYDVVVQSLKMELAEHDWNTQIEHEIAKQILSIFPAFIFQDDATLMDYQKRKKEKIRAHYPIDNWENR